ncbi:hypothetical protein SAMN02910298_00158 [Pseudobutyrivibrio sp. YE44]|uniref:hypothetical protein n=1 Tax=Pseudobutyrivibrio sp. YE44 TaxID=1520802 RepID=UPI00088EB438|nr:hypothetical protein [Pseudobutyrivibrio sp. YE44]SDB06090.1 hypothetical protein SAMN02910298_00158 [Pseudobutyrivibrio sp. YE44]
MITIRTRRKLGMLQHQIGGNKEASFVISLGQNFLDFVDKYSEDEYSTNSVLYKKIEELVEAKDYKALEHIFKTIQVFGTYDRVSMKTIKYKNVKSAVGLTYNGTVFEGFDEEKDELSRIVAHTCKLCSAVGDEYMENMLS